MKSEIEIRQKLQELECPALFLEQNGDTSTVVVAYPLSNPEEMTFPIYSIIKLIISSLVFKAVELEKLQLEDPVGGYISLPKEWVSNLKVKNILAHRSGLGDYGYIDEYQTQLLENPSKPIGHEKLINMVVDRGPLFDQGSDFHYSNVGFLLLKRVIERVYKQSFSEIIKTEFAKPLSLNSTKLALSLDDMEDLEFETMPSPSLRVDDVRSAYHPDWVAHGLLISNSIELTKVLSHIFSGKFIGDQSLEVLTSPVKLPFPGGLFDPHYGYGILGDPKASFGRYLGHDGNGPGYSVAAFNLKNNTAESNCCLVVGKEGVDGKEVLAEIVC